MSAVRRHGANRKSVQRDLLSSSMRFGASRRLRTDHGRSSSKHSRQDHRSRQCAPAQGSSLDPQLGDQAVNLTRRMVTHGNGWPRHGRSDGGRLRPFECCPRGRTACMGHSRQPVSAASAGCPFLGAKTAGESAPERPGPASPGYRGPACTGRTAASAAGRVGRLLPRREDHLEGRRRRPSRIRESGLPRHGQRHHGSWRGPGRPRPDPELGRAVVPHALRVQCQICAGLGPGCALDAGVPHAASRLWLSR